MTSYNTNDLLYVSIQFTVARSITMYTGLLLVICIVWRHFLLDTIRYFKLNLYSYQWYCLHLPLRPGRRRSLQSSFATKKENSNSANCITLRSSFYPSVSPPHPFNSLIALPKLYIRGVELKPLNILERLKLVIFVLI